MNVPPVPILIGMCAILQMCNDLWEYRAVAIRFGVIRLVVCAQERYTLGGAGGMLPQENFEI